MRIAKLLGVAMTIALVATAAVGALPAQAEGPVFCEVNAEHCPAEAVVSDFLSSLIEPGISFGKFIGGGSVICSAAIFHVLKEVELPLWRYKPAPFTFSGCSSATYTNCSLTWQGQYSTTIVASGGGDGTILVFESQPFKEGPPALEVSCAYLKTPFTCVYSTPAFQLQFDGGEPATIHQSISLKKTEGSALYCPEAASTKADYGTLTYPGKEPFPALYVAKS